mmetsp:Transcript_20704/g.62403  ORF Transcript_20704/g.62403 Transcript_20704/m.62403 type:complete len:207 (+) Transcript_20704:751-1371(+)
MYSFCRICSGRGTPPTSRGALSIATSELDAFPTSSTVAANSDLPFPAGPLAGSSVQTSDPVAEPKGCDSGRAVTVPMRAAESGMPSSSSGKLHTCTTPVGPLAANSEPSSEMAIAVSGDALLPGGKHTNPAGSALTSTSTCCAAVAISETCAASTRLPAVMNRMLLQVGCHARCGAVPEELGSCSANACCPVKVSPSPSARCQTMS